jgi:hypothetical protein
MVVRVKGRLSDRGQMVSHGNSGDGVSRKFDEFPAEQLRLRRRWKGGPVLARVVALPATWPPRIPSEYRNCEVIRDRTSSNMMNEADSTFTARNGNAVLLASGTVLMISNEPLEIGISVKDSPQQLFLEISFKEDKADTTPRFEVRGEANVPSKILINMINVSAPMGGGPTEPIKLWTRGQNATIFLVLRVQTVPNGANVVSFTFYDKPEAAK